LFLKPKEGISLILKSVGGSNGIFNIFSIGDP
jgi:hypothetical protein